VTSLSSRSPFGAVDRWHLICTKCFVKCQLSRLQLCSRLLREATSRPQRRQKRTPIDSPIKLFTWIGVGTITMTPTLAGSTVDPFAMMAGAKGLPTSHYDDYSVVFN
jgi:hypothetical protein